MPLKPCINYPCVCHCASELPCTIGGLKQLETLHLGSTLDELDRRGFQNGIMRSVIAFYIIRYNAFITLLGRAFGYTSAVSVVYTYDQKIQTFEYVTRFSSSGNKIEQLPESFVELTNLRWMNLEENLLEKLPDQFGMLVSLEELYLGDLICSNPVK